MDRAYLSYTPSFTQMDFGPGHPLRGDRFGQFMELADKTGLLDVLELVEPGECTVEDLLLVHDQRYLDKVETYARNNMPLSPDTPMSPELPRAARMLVGGTLLAGKTALEHGLCLGFGGMHHAARDRGGGFCVYNDVAVLAEWLKKKGYKRILNLDTDAHCGDGTLDIFYDDPMILYISLHQHPETLYPGRGFLSEIGSGEGLGFSVNLPLSPGSGLEDWRLAMDDIVFPIVNDFRPDVVIRNGGSDPSLWDHLAMLCLDLDGLTYLGRCGRDIAIDHKAPLVDLAMSGYGAGIAEGWLSIWRGTLGLDMDVPAPKAGGRKKSTVTAQENRDMLGEAKNLFSQYWKM